MSQSELGPNAADKEFAVETMVDDGPVFSCRLGGTFLGSPY